MLACSEAGKGGLEGNLVRYTNFRAAPADDGKRQRSRSDRRWEFLKRACEQRSEAELGKGVWGKPGP